MANGSITRGEVAARASRIALACSRCERRGQYSLARLVASLGETFPLTDLAARLSDCPKKADAAWDRCDFYYPGLREIMVGDEP